MSDQDGDKLTVTTSDNKITQTEKGDLIKLFGAQEIINNNQVDQGNGENLAALVNVNNTTLKQGKDEDHAGARLTTNATIDQGAGPDLMAITGDNNNMTLRQGDGNDVVNLITEFEKAPEAKTPNSRDYEYRIRRGAQPETPPAPPVARFARGGTLDGGDGYDQIILDGKREEFNFTFSNDDSRQVQVSRKDAAPNTTPVTLTNYENITFQDQDNKVTATLDLKEIGATMKEMGVKQASMDAINNFVSAKSVDKSKSK